MHVHPRGAAGLAAAAAILAAGCAISGTPAAHPPASRTFTAPVRHGSATAAQITARLAAASLPVTAVITYTATTDPNGMLGRQGGYTSKTAWQDPRAKALGQLGTPAGMSAGSVEYGGGIEVFATPAEAQARAQYLAAFKPPFGDGYDYVAGRAVLRLSNWLAPAQAARYKAAFDAAAGG